jgi:Fe-S cluster biogenesis protein NfuA
MAARERIEEVVHTVLQPLLAKDGGGLEVIAFEGSVLTLRLSGAFLGCPGTSYVKRGVIEPAVRRVVGPDVEIVYERATPFCPRSLPRVQRTNMALIETEEAARRLARAIASDLSLYNEEKIVQGVQGDNLFQALQDEIEEGRALFKSRVSPDLYTKNFYDRAIIDILVRSKGHVPSKLW